MTKKHRSEDHKGRPFAKAEKDPATGKFKPIANGDAEATLQDLLDRLEAWALDMEDWGRQVRIDIVRLEAAHGLPEGDPGDPPPKPWP